MEPLSARTLAAAADLKSPRCSFGDTQIEKQRRKSVVAGTLVSKVRAKAIAWATDFGSGAPGCYKATVNESETINDAKPLSSGSRRQARPLGRDSRFLRFPVAPFIERS